LSKGGKDLTHKDDFQQTIKKDIEARVREGVKAVLEEVLQEEMTEHLKAGFRELTPARKGERNGHYQRNLITPAGKIEGLEMPSACSDKIVVKVYPLVHETTDFRASLERRRA
jgi:hypothetical protein